MTELEWTSYQYQKEKLLAGEMCARLESGHGIFLLNREQMVFVLEAIKDHAEKLMVEIDELQEIDPPIYKNADFWSHVCTLLDTEIDELPEPPDPVIQKYNDELTYKHNMNKIFGSSKYPLFEEEENG